MKKKLNLAILAAAFSFLFFAAHAQNEGAVRMMEIEVDNHTYVEQPKSVEEAVYHQTPTKEVSEKKLPEKKEVIKKVNDLKANAKIVKADRIKKNLKKAEQTTVSKNIKIAIILIVIGAILTIFPALWIIGIGVILVVVGLVILLLEII